MSEDEYIFRKENMKPFDMTLLHKYEESETEADLDSMESCASGETDRTKTPLYL